MISDLIDSLMSNAGAGIIGALSRMAPEASNTIINMGKLRLQVLGAYGESKVKAGGILPFVLDRRVLISDNKSAMGYLRKHFYGRSVLLLLIVLSVLLLSIPVFASQAVRNKLYVNNGRKDICTAVQATIGQGMNVQDVVRTAIQLGNGPCLVVKCAIYGGGDLKKIITGAMQAGAPSDVVSKCALDAGANAAVVSASLLQAGISLCYFEPEGHPYTYPVTTPASMDVLPKPNSNPPISPASF